jgi:hypothetical protein
MTPRLCLVTALDDLDDRGGPGRRSGDALLEQLKQAHDDEIAAMVMERDRHALLVINLTRENDALRQIVRDQAHRLAMNNPTASPAPRSAPSRSDA